MKWLTLLFCESCHVIYNFLLWYYILRNFFSFSNNVILHREKLLMTIPNWKIENVCILIFSFSSFLFVYKIIPTKRRSSKLLNLFLSGSSSFCFSRTLILFYFLKIKIKANIRKQIEFIIKFEKKEILYSNILKFIYLKTKQVKI